MNSKMIKSAFAGLVLSVSSLANAGLIDFNSMSDVAYLGNSDFTVTSYGGPEADTSLTPLIRQEGGISYLCNSTDSNDTSCYSYPTENIIDFDFNLGLDSIDVNMYWAGNPNARGPGASITSFDIDGNVLETFGYSPTQTAQYTFDSVADIYSIQTNSGVTPGENWWYGINSINYTVAEVPEPTTLAIFALGLMGLVSRRFNASK